MRKLLTYGNIKTEKSVDLGWLTAILHLSPGNLSGYEMCKGRSKGCFSACLNSAGHGGIGAVFAANGQLVKGNAVQAARIYRTKLLMEQRAVFALQLVRELEAHIRKANRLHLRPAVRLNGTSDYAWETMPITRNGVEYANAFQAFPEIRFYDYTKIARRMFSPMPSNYSLTFSRAETLASKIAAMQVLENGGNVAVVFDKSLPTHWNGYRVIDGTLHDLRFLDGANVIVGLLAKGKGKRDTSGFIVRAA